MVSRVYRCEGQPDSKIRYAYPPMLRENVSISTRSWYCACVNPDLDIECPSSLNTTQWSNPTTSITATTTLKATG